MRFVLRSADRYRELQEPKCETYLAGCAFSWFDGILTVNPIPVEDNGNA
jgi:hypothetical protein